MARDVGRGRDLTVPWRALDHAIQVDGPGATRRLNSDKQMDVGRRGRRAASVSRSSCPALQSRLPP